MDASHTDEKKATAAQAPSDNEGQAENETNTNEAEAEQNTWSDSSSIEEAFMFVLTQTQVRDILAGFSDFFFNSNKTPNKSNL